MRTYTIHLKKHESPADSRTVTGSGEDIIVQDGLVTVVDSGSLQRVVCGVPVTSVQYIESTDEGE